MKSLLLRIFITLNICFVLGGCKPEDNDEILLKDPLVTTNEIKEIDIPTAIGGGTIINNGGTPIIEQGLCWSKTNTIPTIEDSKTIASIDSSSFNSTLSNLEKNIIYYVRAYARNKYKIGYGSVKIFKAIAKGSFSAITLSTNNITAESAICLGMVSNNGASSIINQGICLSTDSTPTLLSLKLPVSTDSTRFTASFSDLTEKTKYYYRAFAINKNDTAYGDISSFTTLAAYAITNSVSNINCISATINSTIINNGTKTIEQGICWGINNNPTVKDNKQTVATNLTSFNLTLSDLTENTTYYTRTYAINKSDTTYSESISFVTPSALIVNTNSASNRTATSITVSGSYTNNGSTISEQGICYSVNSNPTISDTRALSNLNQSNFSLTISNLLENTTYYARTYVTNQFGTTYGNEISITTAEQTLTLQPGSEGKDACIQNRTPDANNGTWHAVDAFALTNSGNTILGRGLIDFDLTSIPEGTTIKRAYLSLYNDPTSSDNNGQHRGLGTNDAYIKRITSSWDELTVTWNNQPTTTDVNQATIPASTDVYQDYADIDVTSVIQDIMNNRSNSYGLMIVLKNETPYNALIFTSSDYSDSTRRPKIIVKY